MASSSRRNWRVLVALALMLAAMFAYLTTLDEADPEVLPEALSAPATD